MTSLSAIFERRSIRHGMGASYAWANSESAFKFFRLPTSGWRLPISYYFLTFALSKRIPLRQQQQQNLYPSKLHKMLEDRGKKKYNTYSSAAAELITM